MKILVATKKTQGYRDNDFDFVPEGELVTIGTEHDGERVDGECGCRRSLAGIKSRKATTTVKVVDSRIDEDEYKGIIEKSEAKTWEMPVEKVKPVAKKIYVKLVAVARKYPVGTVLEYRGGKFNKRKPRVSRIR